MLIVYITDNDIELLTIAQATAKRWHKCEYRNDWTSFERVTEIAERLTAKYKKSYIAVQNGTMFDVIVAPQVGDAISYAFNGDSTPDGHIVSISKSMKVITSSTGYRYYRFKKTGSWRRHHMWWMSYGHTYERNPHL